MYTATTQTVLLLRTDDITRLTAISGNVDIDAIVPFIYVAQKNEIKRILGSELYNKILTDYDNNTLSGEYEFIYSEFIVDMLSYFSAAYFVTFSPYKITNAGIYRSVPENSDSVGIEEIDSVIKNYKYLANNIELLFVEYMKNITIPEYTSCDDNNSNYGFDWVLD